MKASLTVPNCRIGEILVRNMEVNILRSTRSLRPGTPEGREEVHLRVEVETQGGEIRAEGEAHQVGVRLCRPNEGKEPDHPELIHNHVLGNIRHQSCNNQIFYFFGLVYLRQKLPERLNLSWWKCFIAILLFLATESHFTHWLRVSHSHPQQVVIVQMFRIFSANVTCIELNKVNMICSHSPS